MGKGERQIPLEPLELLILVIDKQCSCKIIVCQVAVCDNSTDLDQRDPGTLFLQSDFVVLHH